MRRAPFPAGRARIRSAFRNKDSIKMNRKKLVGCHSVKFLPIPQFSIHLRIVLPASQAFPLFRSAVSGRSHDAPSPEECMSGGSDVCRAGFPGLHTLPTHPLIGFLHAAQSGCLRNQVVCTIGVLAGRLRAAPCGSYAALGGSWRSRPGCGSPDVGDAPSRYVPVALSRSASGALSRPASVLRLYGMTGGVENRVLRPSISPKRWSNHSERAQSIFSGIVIVVWKRGFPISVCDARMNSHIRATMSG